jgi:hypothetical protein
MAIKTARKQVLSVQEKAFMAEAIQEILDDPDFGLELTESAKKVLRERSQSISKTISADEIKRKYC